MSRLGVFLLLIAGFVAVICPPVFALASEYDMDRPIPQQPAWPAGVADLLNSKKPTYAFFVNFQDNFYYSGDAAAFNAFMERYGKLEGIPHTLVLHCGKGEVKELMKPKIHAFDWYVFVVPPMIPDGGLDKTSPYKRYVTVNLYLGCNIQLSEIKVPANVKVVSGGEIEEFIKKHEARIPKTEVGSAAFGIYLAADEKLNAADALQMKLDEIRLKDKPLLTLDDIVTYRWPNHTIELTNPAINKLPIPGVQGIPFVVVVDGQRVYLGAFWASESSISFRNPVIVVALKYLLSSTLFEIQRAYPGVTPDLPKDDPRDSPLIKAVFETAGKLRVAE